MASRDFLSCWVVGEAWKRPLTGRTLCAFQRIGLHADAIGYSALKSFCPPSYSDLVRGALERTGPRRYALIVPSGIFPTPGFAEKLDRCLETVRPPDAQPLHLPLISEFSREAILAQGITPGQSTSLLFKTGQLHEHLAAKFPSALETTTPVHAGNRAIPRYVIAQGRETFQELEQDGERIILERPLDKLSSEALRAVMPGWVYRCNTEPVCACISEAQGCDTLVAVASGIKPWHFANKLRHSLTRLILIDSSLSQLRFAFEALQAIGDAPNWSTLCRLPGYSSLPDEEFRTQHDVLYETVRAGRNEWRFETIFLHCDLLTQTFRLLDFIKTHRPHKMLFWYSNIFQPHFDSFGEQFSEDHHGIEISFLRLMQQEFPGILLYNSRREPARIVVELPNRCRDMASRLPLFVKGGHNIVRPRSAPPARSHTNMGDHPTWVPQRLTPLISTFGSPIETDSLCALQQSDSRDLSLNTNTAKKAYQLISRRGQGLQSWSEGVDAFSFWRTVAIIPTFGRQEVTQSTVEQCLREPVDVIVVDNKGNYRPIARETVLQPGRNLGWLGGTVYGWAYALCRDWDYFLLLNNDVRLCRDFFRGLLSARQETGAGIVAPCYDGDFTFQHPSSGIQRAADYTPVPRHLRIGYCDGTAMLVTRELVSRVGMFDPTFSPEYGWGASGDYCIRAKEHGFQVVLTEAAYCEHIGHLTAKEVIGESYVAAAAQEQGTTVSRRRGAETWHDELSACSLDAPVTRPCDVSVITATKRRPEQLEQCCRQLKRQQLAGLSVEHIVVSDGPDARARAIAAEHRARYMVSIKPEQFARGEALARDVGLRYAKGDYVVFWDDDNEYTDNCIRTLFETARGYDIGIGQTIHCGGTAESRVIPEDPQSAFLFGHIDTMCLCVRRQAALRVRWADCLGQYASDFIWVEGLRRTGATFRFRPAPIGVHWAMTQDDSTG
jgi:GT2 family glycosyltransferase